MSDRQQYHFPFGMRVKDEGVIDDIFPQLGKP